MEELVEEIKPRCHVCGRTEKECSAEGIISKVILGMCVSCHKHYCPGHTSEFDSTLCSECVSFSNIGIQKKALVDDEGITHKGAQLILTGEAWMRSRDVIAKMTDPELDAKLATLTRAVHEAEMILDYRRIMRSQVESEKSTRLSGKLARLRLISGLDQVHKSTPKPQPKVNGAAKGNEIAADALKALKNLGLNRDAVANVLLKLAQQKGKTK